MKTKLKLMDVIDTTVGCWLVKKNERIHFLINVVHEY